MRVESKVLDNIAFSYFALVTQSKDALDLVFHPQLFDHDVATFAVRWRSVWAGPTVNGVEAYDCDRIVGAREWWTLGGDGPLTNYSRGRLDIVRKFYAAAAVYILQLKDGDKLVCRWQEKQRIYRWSEFIGTMTSHGASKTGGLTDEGRMS